MRSRRVTLAVALGLAFLLMPARVEAHAVITSAGPFYGGLKHFFISIDDVLAAVAVALLAGLRGTPTGWRGFWGISLAWIVSGVMGIFSGLASGQGGAASASSLLMLGVLVAADRNLRGALIGTLAALTGGLHGFLNGVELQEAGATVALQQLGGISVAMAVLVLYLLSLQDMFLGKHPWLRIPLRVLGSWIAATGLLLLGWTLRPQ
jgi:hydrogenase/urease accessory protein HupE